MRNRTALVLGGGGLVGAAFEAGVLAGLHEASGWDARTAEVIIGTSAGSHVATLLRSGFAPKDLLALQTHDSCPSTVRVWLPSSIHCPRCPRRSNDHAFVSLRGG